MSLDAEYLVSEIRGILAAHGLTPRRDRDEAARELARFLQQLLGEENASKKEVY